MTGSSPAAGAWSDAALAAALLAVDPAGCGGAVLRAHPGPVRDAWLSILRDFLPPEAPVRRVPLNVADGRLLGGLDLAATLRAGRPIAERGLLAEADGGVVVLAMAERVSAATAARLTAAMDFGEVAVERDAVAARVKTRFAVVALDEGLEDERPPAALLERLAFLVTLEGVHSRDTFAPDFDAEDIASARARLRAVVAGDDMVEALCAAAMAFGIASVRACVLALHVARIAAALAGRERVDRADATLAARLVLAPRATQLPAAEDEPTPPQPEENEPSQDDAPSGEMRDAPLEDSVVEAIQAAIPPGLLEQLRLGVPPRIRAQNAGRAGQVRQSQLRGRPAGVRRGEPRGGARLDAVETLRAAAPWQPVRRRERGHAASTTVAFTAARVEVRREDFRVVRRKQRTQTTTIFVVDASGSTALHRLGEAKGAIELLLADCYVRRDQVALIAFRGPGADLLLPPTRSLTRAKRSLAALPGGGGTPLASGIDAAVALADAVQRRGETPVVVLLTDGRANLGRDGKPGRAQAADDALAAAREARARGLACILIDTAPQPQATAQRLAAEMDAQYLALPHADAALISRAVQSATQQPLSAATAARGAVR